MVFAEIYGDFEYSVTGDEVTITKYNGSGGAVVIPDTINGNTVTAIGNTAFMGKNSIESIEIPGSVTSIGNQAFYQCTSLSSVTFGKDSQLTSIGDYAFQNCTNLASLTLPDSVASIGIQVFYSCKSLASIDIPDGVTTIGDSAFAGCANLANVTFGDNSKLASIGVQAFNGCASLESIEIPSSVTSIGYGAFDGCTSLESIFLPKDLDVTNAKIPDAASQVRYSLDEIKGEVTITEIALGTDKSSVAIPATICGYPVVAVAASEQYKVGAHTCKGGTATCTDKALCSICGKEYGDLLDHNLENIPAKDATLNEEGNIEYWHCLTCGRLFSDKKGINEISLEDTVIKKLTPETDGDKDQSTKADAEDSVKTGDDANLALWLALMLLSGAGITGVTAYTRRKRTNE